MNWLWNNLNTMRLKKVFSENTLVALLLSVFFLLFAMIAIGSEATYDAGDGIRHYLIARYSWNHSYLMLDTWGKPFFTLVCSPFAQFGLIGAVFFNILCGIGASFFAYKICKKLELNHAWMAIPFGLFASGYFPTLNSGLTEPFFSFVLISAVYAVLCKKFNLAAVVISFLPLVRTEGVFIIPLFMLVMLYRKQFKSILLLGTGGLIYALIGLMYFNDFFWLINQNPYNGVNREFYGSGELLHFVKSHNYIFGTTMLILFLSGLIGLGANVYARKKKGIRIENTYVVEDVVLILGSFLVYFIIHSIMWWKGWANSLGLLRVIAAVLPCAAILAVRGFNLLLIDPIRRQPILVNMIILGTLCMVIRSPFKHEYFPYRLDQEQGLINEAGEWFKKTPYTSQKIYYLYPFLAHVLDIDSFDPKKVAELWGLYPTIKEHGIDAIPDSTIVFWDAHFGPNECRIPLDTILNDANFKLIKSFKPKEEFTTLGGHYFEIFVFMKLAKPKDISVIQNKLYDFDKDENLLQNQLIIDDSSSYSGKRMCCLGAFDEFSTTVLLNASEIPPATTKLIVNAKVLCEQADTLKANMVVSVNNTAGKNISWEGKKITLKTDTLNKLWKTFTCAFSINPQLLSVSENKFSIYVWNKDKEKFCIDNLELKYFGVK